MGRRHLRVMAAMPELFQLAAGFDTHESPHDFPLGLWREESEEAAIRSADLVVIATPAQAHEGAVRRSLLLGKHVFVEKPLCLDANEGAALLELARAKGCRLLVGHSERFNPVIRAIQQELVREGERPRSIVLERRGPSRIDDVGVLLNFGVHDFDIAEWLSGESIHLSLVTGKQDPLMGLDRACDVRFRWGHAGTGRISVERTKETRARRIEVVTARATYRGDMLQQELCRTTDDGDELLTVDTSVEPLVLQARALVSALRGGAGEVATEAAGLRAVELATEAFHRIPRRGHAPLSSSVSAPPSRDGEGTRASRVTAGG